MHLHFIVLVHGEAILNKISAFIFQGEGLEIESSARVSSVHIFLFDYWFSALYGLRKSNNLVTKAQMLNGILDYYLWFCALSYLNKVLNWFRSSSESVSEVTGINLLNLQYVGLILTSLV